MAGLFIRLFNISISAGFFVLAVLLFRVIFKKAPKFISVILFGLVGFRLILPISIESNISLVPSKATLPENIELEQYPMIESGISAVDEIVNPFIKSSFAPVPEASANPMQILIGIFAYLWIIVATIMILYLLFSYVFLKRKLKESVLLEGRIYASDRVKTPFILGIVKPKIYVPSNVGENDLAIIKAHEEAHISRGDHLWKPIAFVILSVYWFNPVLWLAYYFLCRDIELACDEKVMKSYTDEQKASYSETLLKMSSGAKRLGVCPLAFGEVGVKARIIRIRDYTKPAAVVIILSIITTTVLGACFLTDKKVTDPSFSEGIYYVKEKLYAREDNEDIVEDIPYFVFYSDGTASLVSRSLNDGIIDDLGKRNRCYVSKKDYNAMFEGGDFDAKKLRKSTSDVYLIEIPESVKAVLYSKLYVFVQKSGEIFIGLSKSNDKSGVIDGLYSTITSGALPASCDTVTYREILDKSASGIQLGWIKSFSITPKSKTMSIGFGILSSYIAYGTYETDGNRVVLTTKDSYAKKFVFDLSTDTPIFLAEGSTSNQIKDGTKFERVSEHSMLPTSTFADFDDDGKYDHVEISLSDNGCDITLDFTVSSNGKEPYSISTPFKKYDKIDFVKDISENKLSLICRNGDNVIEIDRYYVVFENNSVELVHYE